MVKFFKKQPSSITMAGGPSAEQQLDAMTNDRYWTVLNSDILNNNHIRTNNALRTHANALKTALQTFGPQSDQLPDKRVNQGSKVYGQVLHGHVKGDGKATFILEWAIVDAKTRTLALTNFDTHENFNFKKKPLTDSEIKRILADKNNQLIIDRAKGKINEAKEKAGRIENNYRHQYGI